jgi:hypothetical protein
MRVCKRAQREHKKQKEEFEAEEGTTRKFRGRWSSNLKAPTSSTGSLLLFYSPGAWLFFFAPSLAFVFNILQPLFSASCSLFALFCTLASFVFNTFYLHCKKRRVVAPRKQTNKDQTKKDQADLGGGGPTVRVARRNIT